jgi:hypothetical protein
MLTEATTTVDGTLPGLSQPPRAVMLTVSEVAERDRVSKQAVSKKVKELIDLGLTVERDSRGFVSKLNVVEYDRLRGRTDDPSKAQAPGRSAAAPAAKPVDDQDSYKEALRTKTWHESERLRLDLEERRGELLRVDAVADAVMSCATTITAIVDRLPNVADDLVAAIAKDGVHGVRVALKQMAAKLRTDIAKALTGIADGAPKTDSAADDDGAHEDQAA